MKYIRIKPEDIKGNYALMLTDVDKTVPYRYFFKKIKGKVYRMAKIGNEDWRVDEMPFDEIPFVVMET